MGNINVHKHINNIHDFNYQVYYKQIYYTQNVHKSNYSCTETFFLRKGCFSTVARIPIDFTLMHVHTPCNETSESKRGEFIVAHIEREAHMDREETSEALLKPSKANAGPKSSQDTFCCDRYRNMLTHTFISDSNGKNKLEPNRFTSLQKLYRHTPFKNVQATEHYQFKVLHHTTLH